MEFNNIKKYLNTVGKKTVEDAKKSLSRRDHISTGRLRDSVKYKIVESKGLLNLKITSLKYGLVLDKGFSGYETKRDTPFTIKASNSVTGYIRGNTVYTPWQDIQSWVKSKGIGGQKWKSAAYLINRKLKLHGLKPTRWLEKVKNKNLASKRYRKAINNALMKDIQAHYKKNKYLRK